jgi:hypothetical protein
MTRNLAGTLVTMAFLLAFPCPAAAEGEVRLEGQVFDRAGQAVGGVPVRVLMTRRVLQIGEFTIRDDVGAGPATRTDDRGFFALTFVPDPDFDYFYLRFYDAVTFDAVRYAPPADEDITMRVREGRSVIVQRRLEDAPSWPALVREMDRVGGPQSPQGKILRALGLPDAVVPLQDGLTEWRYERMGLRYRMRDGKVIETVRQGTPVSPPAPVVVP